MILDGVSVITTGSEGLFTNSRISAELVQVVPLQQIFVSDVYARSGSKALIIKQRALYFWKSFTPSHGRHALVCVVCWGVLASRRSRGDHRVARERHERTNATCPLCEVPRGCDCCQRELGSRMPPVY